MSIEDDDKVAAVGAELVRSRGTAPKPSPVVTACTIPSGKSFSGNPVIEDAACIKEFHRFRAAAADGEAEAVGGVGW